MCLKYRFKETFNIAKNVRIEGFCAIYKPGSYQMAGYGTVQNVVNLIAVQPAVLQQDGRMASWPSTGVHMQ